MSVNRRAMFPLMAVAAAGAVSPIATGVVIATAPERIDVVKPGQPIMASEMNKIIAALNRLNGFDDARS